MELEQLSSCCSSTSLSPSSAAADSSSGEDAADRTELEAAEALADLAQFAIMREKVVESAAKWGSKGKRVRKRVKNESPSCDSRWKPADLELPAPDLAESSLASDKQQNTLGYMNEKFGILEGAVQEEQEAQAISRDLTIVAVKTEVDDGTPKQPLAYTLRCGSSGGRSRQNLSEAEKEERRIRRILANRESARQTIRRRQALCEELNRKASDLSYENAQLKREKARALKEFQSMEMINKHLREQISRSIESEAKKHEVPKASHVETPASTSFNCYDQHPFQLFCWPPVIQSSDSALLLQNGFTVSSTTSVGASTKIETFQELEKPANDDGTKAPFYIWPCPWFRPDQSSGVPSMQEGSFSNGHCNNNSSGRPVEDIQSLPSDIPSRNRDVVSGSMETRPLYDLNESASDIPSEGGDAHMLGFHPEQHRLSGGPSFFKHDDASQLTTGVTALPPGHVLISLTEKNQGFVEYSSKRLVDAMAAAKARKRRKELTRLKNLHGRQCRMQV